MKILVIGGGGREHALAWKLASSRRVSEVIVAPGNAGTARESRMRNAEVAADDIEGLLALAKRESVNFARGRLDGQRRSSQEIMRTVHAALGGGLLVLLYGHFATPCVFNASSKRPAPRTAMGHVLPSRRQAARIARASAQWATVLSLGY